MAFLLERLLARIHNRPITAAAAATWQLAPAEQTVGKPALMLDDNVATIMANIPGSNAELETNRILGRPCTHFPTIAYDYRNVRIAGPYIASGLRLLKYSTNRPSADRSNRGRIDEAFLSTNILSGQEFGHWLRDALVSEIYGVELGLPVIGLAREPWQHEPAYRAVADLPCDYLYAARLGRLVMIDDRGLTSHWAERFIRLRGRMRAGIDPQPGPSAGPLIFLDRGAGGRLRDPTNSAQIRDMLIGLGFQTVTPTDMAAPDIGRALRDARLAVSVEGSHLNHLHSFAPEGLTLITLQDPRRFSAHHKRIVDIYGDRFGIVVGEPDPEQDNRYRIDLDTLRRVIDLAP